MASTKRTAARTQIAAGWQPSPDDREFAEARGVNITAEAERFLYYHQERGTLSANWQASWRTWCLRSVEFGRASGQRTLPLLALVSGSGPAPGDDQTDAYGARRWAARLPDARPDTLPGGTTPVPCIDGQGAAETAADVCAAAGLSVTWRGDLDAVADWLRSGLDPDQIVDAVRRARKPQGDVKSLRFFDGFVRSLSTKASG